MNPQLEPFPLPGKTTFSAAVRAGQFLYCAGLTAVDENRKLVGEGDMGAQARFIYRKLAAVLERAGATLADVVETVDYVTTFDGYAATADVRREVFAGGPYPAATGVKVSELVRPGALIEIRAIAWLGERDSGGRK